MGVCAYYALEKREAKARGERITKKKKEEEKKGGGGGGGQSSVKELQLFW